MQLLGTARLACYDVLYISMLTFIYHCVAFNFLYLPCRHYPKFPLSYPFPHSTDTKPGLSRENYLLWILNLLLSCPTCFAIMLMAMCERMDAQYSISAQTDKNRKLHSADPFSPYTSKCGVSAWCGQFDFHYLQQQYANEGKCDNDGCDCEYD